MTGAEISDEENYEDECVYDRGDMKDESAEDSGESDDDEDDMDTNDQGKTNGNETSIASFDFKDTDTTSDPSNIDEDA